MCNPEHVRWRAEKNYRMYKCATERQQNSSTKAGSKSKVAKVDFLILSCYRQNLLRFVGMPKLIMHYTLISMMEDFTLIEFKVTDEFYGYPHPFISTGAIVILIQDGKTSISKYHEPTVDEPFPEFTHPSANSIKNKEIEQELSGHIQQHYPQYFSSNESVILLCPGKYWEEIEW